MHVNKGMQNKLVFEWEKDIKINEFHRKIKNSTVQHLNFGIKDPR